LGAFVFALSLFSGIVWGFWREFGNDLFIVPSRVAYAVLKVVNATEV